MFLTQGEYWTVYRDAAGLFRTLEIRESLSKELSLCAASHLVDADHVICHQCKRTISTIGTGEEWFFDKEMQFFCSACRMGTRHYYPMQNMPMRIADLMGQIRNHPNYGQMPADTHCHIDVAESTSIGNHPRRTQYKANVYLRQIWQFLYHGIVTIK